VRPANLSSWDRMVKRALDVALVLISAPVMVPVFAAVAAAIKLDSKGPVFYTSLRVGKGGRFFAFIKFRSMVPDADRQLTQLERRNEKDGHLFKLKDDPRITRVGRFLRRFSIDELPQLINVLLGHMSLVGPRPLPVQTFRLDGESPKFGYWGRQRHSVLPGMTGLWQVRGRSDLDFGQIAGLDLHYIRHWSLRLDLWILLLTLPAVLRRRGAY
jgi:lipopolysaccharide/colanic/teichoic acid biosynthesis glycosyltransferase